MPSCLADLQYGMLDLRLSFNKEEVMLHDGG